MAGLSEGLYRRCRITLLKCDQFDSDDALRNLFMIDALYPFRHRLPDSTNKSQRIDQYLDFGLSERLDDGRLVLLASLAILCQKYQPGDAFHGELENLLAEVKHELDSPDSAPYQLKFSNRSAEKEMIGDLLDRDFYVQIHAPGGLGKTYLLREIQREKESTGWRTVWIDLASEAHQACNADRYALLQEFAQQAFGDAAPNVAHLEEGTALRLIGRQLAERGDIALFIDNADRADIRLLTWIRATFLETLATWVPIRAIASGQQTIPEWQGHRTGRPFRKLVLSGFEDPSIIRDIIDDLAGRFGTAQVKRRREAERKQWQADLEIMVEGLLQISLGHPLAIERVLDYAIKNDGLMHAGYFTDNRAQLIDRCLGPIVGERILPTIDRCVREAFRSLCVFRFVWPTLVRSLTEVKVSNDLGGPWEPFSNGMKSPENWWSGLQDTHLIDDVSDRAMYPISSTIRRVIAVVLQVEDEALFQARNFRARLEYQKLLDSPQVSSEQRAACALEIIYHTTQDESLSPEQATSFSTELLTGFLESARRTDIDSFIKARDLLMKWLREDTELRTVVNRFAPSQAYEQLMNTVRGFVTV